MILLLGGTSETAELSEALADAGFDVLVSTATEVPLNRGEHPRILHRSGMLDEDEISALVVEQGIHAIVDATHPYASSIRSHARNSAARLNIPYFTWIRPTCVGDDDALFADDHEHAAKLAFSFRRPVLLTTGSRNLLPYVAESRRAGISLTVRVLPYPDSLEACRRAGLEEECIVTGRGPFSTEENLQAIRQFGIGVLVTKDSGIPGGVPAKLEACRLSGCRVVVVRRPEDTSLNAFTSLEQLVRAIPDPRAGNKKR